ncbi:hypothetical protein LINPERPRIM_LOCUS22121 [Linum perenne]
MAAGGFRYRERDKAPTTRESRMSGGGFIPSEERSLKVWGSVEAIGGAGWMRDEW